jgi:biotin-(acetyl-CoA carboxylase) ligase
VASVAEIDGRLDAVALLHRVAPAVLRALLAPVNDATWRSAWARRDLLAGRRVDATGADAPIRGVACGIRDDGALLLRADADGQILVVASGEVSIRPLPRTTP